MNLVDLPNEMIDNILSYLSYEETAQLRRVNSFFNTVCSHRLNRGFNQVDKLHCKCLKDIKKKLPRRESERKGHPLARHSDILMALESRLSMLSITFTKHIELKQCCFIPGKVLDEAMRLLRIIHESCANLTESKPNVSPLPRPHEFLQEFRDLSSMAMEYFEEKVLPEIRERARSENNFGMNEQNTFAVEECKNTDAHSRKAESLKRDKMTNKSNATLSYRKNYGLVTILQFYERLKIKPIIKVYNEQCNEDGKFFNALKKYAVANDIGLKMETRVNDMSSFDIEENPPLLQRKGSSEGANNDESAAQPCSSAQVEGPPSKRQKTQDVNGCPKITNIKTTDIIKNPSELKNNKMEKTASTSKQAPIVVEGELDALEIKKLLSVSLNNDREAHEIAKKVLLLLKQKEVEKHKQEVEKTKQEIEKTFQERIKSDMLRWKVYNIQEKNLKKD